MRKILAVALVVLFFLIPSASAQFLGQLSPAPTLHRGDSFVGGYLGVYEHAFSLIGQYRFGMARYVDLGLKLAMVNLNSGGGDNTGLALSGDAKYWFMERATGDPIDLSFGGGMEYAKISDFSIFGLGINTVGSYKIEYGKDKSVTPYGCLNLRWARTSSDKSGDGNGKEDGGGSSSHSDVDVALALGAELKVSSRMHLIGELEIDDYVGFIGGINYNLF
ncbi:MAG: hypothetical protein WCE90_05430 [Candidatus Zixiibacteriota bacterium]